MNPTEIILTALSLAFCWVNYINKWLINILWIDKGWIFNGKPFACVKCMTGWIGLIIGVVVYGWPGLLFLPAGVFAGAMFEALTMRYL